MTSPKPPPMGWYTDPSNPSLERYWDGQTWTNTTRQKMDRPPPLPPGAATPSTSAGTQPASLETLNLEISRLVGLKYNVQQSELGRALLVRHRAVNHVLHLVLFFLTFGLWGWVWLALALSFRDSRVELSITPQGGVDSRLLSGVYPLVQGKRPAWQILLIIGGTVGFGIFTLSIFFAMGGVISGSSVTTYAPIRATTAVTSPPRVTVNPNPAITDSTTVGTGARILWIDRVRDQSLTLSTVTFVDVLTDSELSFFLDIVCLSKLEGQSAEATYRSILASKDDTDDNNRLAWYAVVEGYEICP